MSRDDWPESSYIGSMMEDLRRKRIAPRAQIYTEIYDETSTKAEDWASHHTVDEALQWLREKSASKPGKIGRFKGNLSKQEISRFIEFGFVYRSL